MLVKKDDVELARVLFKFRGDELLSERMSQDVWGAMDDAIGAGRVGIVRLFVKCGVVVGERQLYKTISGALRRKDILRLTRIFISAPSFKENCPDAIEQAIAYFHRRSIHKELVVMLLHAGFDRHHPGPEHRCTALLIAGTLRLFTCFSEPALILL
ncbi:hypothetical protein ACJ73_06899 [Blastomyces percursus]|uniref:Uncharacterized protein n=1 Tax=Blastomyces percursus TaxID=1658174 RepID=A0A1J9Q0X3_9EURO|nr:hypothetical protein ACJ73_06899 [Blastomyces percursus]